MKNKQETLENEIKTFVENLPYWGKYLGEKILSGKDISEDDTETSYSYLLEELQIKDVTEKSEIEIICNTNTGDYKKDLLLTKLENVEGVNALTENQAIDFSPNLTIVYGVNGSGKSGYARLLKKTFYSKAPEDILQNVHLVNGHKPINAKFTFNSSGSDIHLSYSQKNNSEFEQFAVFDGKCLPKQLSEKSEFEFRPFGLSFFADYTNAVVQIEQKLNTDIAIKKSGNTANDLSDLFDGESEIKTIIQSLSAQTSIDKLKKYTPFSDENKAEKEKIQKQYDDIILASKGKEKELKNLEAIKKQLGENKAKIERINIFFQIDYLTKIKDKIEDCVTKTKIAKAEGIEKFQTDNIEGIGSEEWKDFIVTAEEFAKKQKIEGKVYPENNDNCLFCQQPLSEDAKKLVINYWKFIKGVSEENAQKAQEKLEIVKQAFEKLNFDLFPEDNTLTIWLNEKYSNELEKLKKTLLEQKTLAQNIVSDIQNKTANKRAEINTSTTYYITIEEAINKSIKIFEKDEQVIQLAKLLEAKTFLEHKEKFNNHFSKFEEYVDRQIWLDKAGKVSFKKHKITGTEKILSDKYFNQKYIDAFNNECEKLNAKFGIEINHTGTAGKTYRQLLIKGNDPFSILSEGEQKVIALADFIVEMQLSEINKGIIFDDPVNSLDDKRKSEIAKRLIEEAQRKQVVILTHDLVFLSILSMECEHKGLSFLCHWIEKNDNIPGYVWLNNSPSYEKKYRNLNPVKEIYALCNKDNCSPMARETYVKQGFTHLRTCYEVLVINDLFKGVVQRYNERVSIDALSKVSFDNVIVDELLDSYAQCCRYMEGHTHSDEYAYIKPELKNLNNEMLRYEEIRSKIKKSKKEN